MKPMLLVFPGEKTQQPFLPLSVLVLAAYLRNHGIGVEVLDTRISSYDSVDFGKYLLIGVSVTVGERLVHAYKISQYIKNNYPTTLIVWGGYLPSAYPELVCQSGLVDIVIRGEGEKTLLEVAKRLDRGTSFSKVRGVTYKKGGEILSNPCRSFLDMNQLPLPAFDLLELGKYCDGKNYISMETSRGCPHNCSHCISWLMDRGKWRAKSAHKVAAEIRRMKKRFNASSFFFWDSNFFADKRRVMEICNSIAPLEVHWSAMARVDSIAGFSDREIALMKRAGLTSLSAGAESGSQKVLNLLRKNTNVTSIKLAAAKCSKHSIPLYLSFVLGTPGEEAGDVKDTIALCKFLESIPHVFVKGYWLLAMYPGIALPEADSYMPQPKTLKELSRLKPEDYASLKWLGAAQRRKAITISKITKFMYMHRQLAKGASIGKVLGSPVRTILWKAFFPLAYLDAKLRWNSEFFGFGIEWLLIGHIWALENGDG